jgi:hypothetical protein
MARTVSIKQRPAFLVRDGLREPWLALPGLSRRGRDVLIVALLILAMGVAAVVGARLVTETTNRSYRGILEQAGTVLVPRFAPALVTLGSGDVLIVGDGSPDVTAEIFDPSSGTTKPAGPTASNVSVATAVELLDGRILILGWEYGPTANTGRQVAELYDPIQDTFSIAGRMTTSRLEAAAVRLADGRVLISGGSVDEQGIPMDSAEIYDPVGGTFLETGRMVTSRSGHRMTALDDGRVLVTGGYGGEENQQALAAEVYVPATGTFRSVGAITGVDEFRGSSVSHVAPIGVGDGRVLIFGAQGPQRCGLHGIDPLSTYLFDPATDSFSSAPKIPHTIETATLLTDGRVLLTGTWQAVPGGCATGSEYVFDAWIGVYDLQTGETLLSLDPITGISTLSADTDLSYTAAVMLDDGRVLLHGSPSLSQEQGPGILHVFE